MTKKRNRMAQDAEPTPPTADAVAESGSTTAATAELGSGNGRAKGGVPGLTIFHAPASEGAPKRRGSKAKSPGTPHGQPPMQATPELQGTPSEPAKPSTLRRRRRPSTQAEPTVPASPATPPSKLSALDAAARVLAETGQALTCKQLIEAMAARGYWTSPGGKTPHATLYVSLAKEIKVKGPQARFRKVGPGTFALNQAS